MADRENYRVTRCGERTCDASLRMIWVVFGRSVCGAWCGEYCGFGVSGDGCAAAGAVEGFAAVAGGEDCADEGIGDSGLFEDIECGSGGAAAAGDAGAEVGGLVVGCGEEEACAGDCFAYGEEGVVLGEACCECAAEECFGEEEDVCGSAAGDGGEGVEVIFVEFDDAADGGEDGAGECRVGLGCGSGDAEGAHASTDLCGCVGHDADDAGGAIECGGDADSARACEDADDNALAA